MKRHGLTAQYVTLAIALRIQLVEYFQSYDLLAERGRHEGNEELEARRLTIVLLTAALCESCINTALALSLSPDEFNDIERRPTLKKWFTYSKRVNPKFNLDPASDTGHQLAFIFECRNAVVHAQAEVYTETDTIHPGNHSPWHLLTHERILTLVTIPVRLLIPLWDGTDPLIACMSSGVQWQLALKEFENRAARTARPILPRGGA